MSDVPLDGVDIGQTDRSSQRPSRVAQRVLVGVVVGAVSIPIVNGAQRAASALIADVPQYVYWHVVLLSAVGFAAALVARLGRGRWEASLAASLALHVLLFAAILDWPLPRALQPDEFTLPAVAVLAGLGLGTALWDVLTSRTDSHRSRAET